MSRFTYEDEFGGEVPRMYIPRWTPAIKVLILINVGVFVLQLFYYLFARDTFAHLLGVSLLSIQESPVLGPFRLLTYQFVHSYRHIFHLLMNLLVLFFFGTMVEKEIGGRATYGLYLFTGLLGGLCWLLFSAMAGVPGLPCIGASGAAFGIMVYAAFMAPRTQVIFIILVLKLWVLAAIAGLVALYSTLVSLGSGPSGVAHAAHVGGMVGGGLLWRFGPALGALWGRLETRAGEKAARRRRERERKLDQLLAKINEVGMSGLTPSERKFLRRYSRGPGS